MFKLKYPTEESLKNIIIEYYYKIFGMNFYRLEQ